MGGIIGSGIFRNPSVVAKIVAIPSCGSDLLLVRSSSGKRG